MERWHESRFTGLFVGGVAVPLRAHDPDIAVWGGECAAAEPGGQRMTAGGAGWDSASAEGAGIGEAIERLHGRRLPSDGWVGAAFGAWPLDEPAVDPQRWVLFHEEQLAQPDFPFVPLSRTAVCPWVCFRQAETGLPWWVPEELAFLGGAGGKHSLCPGLSTGLSCGRMGQSVLLRGLHEVIERDGLIGAWWGRYPLEEWPIERVLAGLPQSVRNRLPRPNLHYRAYRVDSPFSHHITMVTLEGEDIEGYCFSVGSACRETRDESWNKSCLEAVQGRHYVRWLKRERPARDLLDFPDHAVYYSHHPERLAETVFARGVSPISANEADCEDIGALVSRLGPERPVLFRNLTPPGIAAEFRDWHVLRVLVPGLQPLHGNDRFPLLGGPLWAPRKLADWSTVPPHPFP